MSIQPIRKLVTPEIPDKLYFRIGDVARLLEVPAYVLRFWETEFPQLKPNKGGTGQRLYRKRDVEMAFRIKSLLYDQGYTIPGARQVFKSEAKEREAAAAEAALPVPSGTEPAVSAVTPAKAAVTAPNRGDDLRRKAGLRALRDELCALLVILEQPVSSSLAPPAARTQPRLQTAPAPKALRPRLVLEPRPEPKAPAPLETLQLVADPRAQGDLFAGE